MMRLCRAALLLAMALLFALPAPAMPQSTQPPSGTTALHQRKERAQPTQSGGAAGSRPRMGKNSRSQKHNGEPGGPPL
jgi:hypothetical protein